MLNFENNYEKVLPTFNVRYWDILFNDNMDDDSAIFTFEIYWPLMGVYRDINQENIFS